MPTFQFEALDQTGKQQKGAVDAVSSDEAIARIKAQGYFPTSVREKKVKKREDVKDKGKKKKEKTLSFGGRVKVKVLTQFTRQLSTLVDAGLPILRSLQILVDQQPPGTMKNVLTDICSEVEAGTSLSEGMSKHQKVFDRLYYKMIAAGEVGGVLDIILQRLADFMEKAARLKAKIKGAMVYPVVVITVAMLILTGIMIFVVPKFQEIFADFDTDLPAPTLFLMGAADWVVGKDRLIPGYIIIFGSPFFMMFVAKIMNKSQGGKMILDKFKMSIPVFGKLIRLNAIAKFTRTLGTLISAGVPILEAILITRDTIGNYLYENALQKVHDSIREGETFAVPLREARVVDSMVVNMVDVGEETGDLDKMLMKIADNYDEEVDVAVNALVSMLEPLMVVFLGGTVGFIVIALFLPLVKLIQNVSK